MPGKPSINNHQAAPRLVVTHASGQIAQQEPTLPKSAAPAVHRDDAWTMVQNRRVKPPAGPATARVAPGAMAPQPPTPKAAADALSEHRRHLLGRSGREVSAYVSSLRAQGRYREVELVLLWAVAQPEHRRSLFLYNQLLQAVKRDLAKLEDVRAQMKRVGVPDDLITYTIIIDAYGKAGLTDTACAIFTEMEQAEIQGDVATFSSLVAAAAAADDTKKAMWALAKMQAHGCRGDAQLYNVAMHLFSKNGLHKQAWLTSEAMDQAGIASTVVTWNTRIQMCIAAGDWERAWCNYATMKRQIIEADVQTYNILINLCGKTQGAQRAWRLMGYMQQKNIAPTAITYGTIIDILAKEDAVDLVRMTQAYKQMRAAGLQPNGITCTVLISTFYAAGKFQECLDLLRHETVPVAAQPMLAEVHRRLKHYPEAWQLCNEVLAATQRDSGDYQHAWIVKQCVAQSAGSDRAVQTALREPPFGSDSPHWPRYLSLRVFSGIRDSDVKQQRHALEVALESVSNNHGQRDVRRAISKLGVK